MIEGKAVFSTATPLHSRKSMVRMGSVLYADEMEHIEHKNRKIDERKKTKEGRKYLLLAP